MSKNYLKKVLNETKDLRDIMRHKTLIVAIIRGKIFYCIYNAASKLSDRDAEIERGSYITNCARDTRFIINHHPTLTTYNIM